MLKEFYPYWLAGQAASGANETVVLNKFNGELVTRVARADRETLLEAIAAAQAASRPMAQMAAYERAAGLRHCAARFEERAEELAQVLCLEAGKPIRDARGEVGRLVDTFRIASEEATRMGGEVLPLDVTERARDYRGMWKRVPIGPCGFITPWNFPLNLVAHKVAPALAVGNPFVLKPASATPLGALLIGEILAELDLPPGAFSILPCSVEDAAPLVEDERLKLLSFTGSHQVGWELKARAGKKHVQLELGGNAACIVDADADIEDTVSRLVMGAFYQSGQSCIGVQRILVHESIYPDLRRQLIKATEALVSGDPSNEDTFVGPMISEHDAQRLQSWIEEAVEAGANLLVGGGRDGSLLEASLLEDVPSGLSLCQEEAFGPVAVLSTFANFDDALKEVNDSKYGLQAGLFTRDIHKANRAWDELEVGAVVVGDVPSWRVDHMPYGGVKDSGLGREGLRFAMQEQTEMRLLVIRDHQT
jgi:acyl-CoA reductase-like NAD-dependent aldehyde dehydrogenase